MKPQGDVVDDLDSKESRSGVVCAIFGCFVDRIDLVQPIGKAPKQQSMEPILATRRRLLLPCRRGGLLSGRTEGDFRVLVAGAGR